MIPTPSAQARVNDLADFMELESWRNRSTSLSELLSATGRLDDNEYNEGVDDSDDCNAVEFENVLLEIERRINACGGGYPFSLTANGTVLSDEAEGTNQQLLYRYLLLSTQLNMNTEKMQAHIDRTQLLEKVSSEALEQYLGKSRARSIVFGTAKPGGFTGKVNYLCHELNEGRGFRNIDPGVPTAKDGKLDSVAWLPFADGLPGKVILFCQCKTGSSWRGQITQLRPEDFAAKFMEQGFLVNPLRVFCISAAICHLEWNSLTIDGGILIDRCRLVELCECLSSRLLEDIYKWTEAAMIPSEVPSGRLIKMQANS
jgi:hypothetical protein